MILHMLAAVDGIVGEKIKSLRESQSISMEELAQRSGLAIEQIERIENNIDRSHPGRQEKFPNVHPVHALS